MPFLECFFRVLYLVRNTIVIDGALMDYVLIEGLRLNMIIGVFEWERLAPQPVIVDLKLFPDLNRYTAIHDDINNVLNYKAVVDRIETEVTTFAPELVETLGEHLCQIILSEFAVKHVELTLKKPNAIPTASAVGVYMARPRSVIRNDH